MATRRKTHINTPANGTHLGQDRVNHANELKRWFCKLTPEERGRVLLVEDKDGNNVLRQMFKTRKGMGEVLFYRGIAEDLDLPPQLKRKIGASLSRNDFCYLKINSLSTTCFYPEKFLLTDKRLEDSVRLCDTREYLDTFTLTSNLFEDGKDFIKLMQIVTRGNFLSTPCRVSYDASKKIWIWEGPKWFEGMGFYSLGTWISHKIEKTLWMRYWDSHRLDPRTKNYSILYTFPNVLEGLLSKNYLIQFWKSHNTQERRKIVGSIGDIVRHVIFNSNDDSDKNKYKQGLDYPRLLSQLVEISTQERNLEVLFDDRDLSQNEKTFIEILYFSPLERAGTTIDMILRRIGMSIHSAYTEKISMDLIVGEEAEKIKQAAQSEAKKKRRKKKKEKVSKKKKEQQEKENKEKEQKEREEKERKERERMAQEQLKMRKAISLMIGDIISNAEQKIEQQKRQKELADEEERRKLVASILSIHSNQTNGKENEVATHPNSKTVATVDAKRKSKSRKKKKKPQSTDLIFETRAESKEVNGSADEPPATDQIIRINRTLYHRREEYIIRLHQEIEDYASMTKTMIKTYYVPRVEAIIEKLHAIATSLWQNAHIKVYGSYATSLCIPSSDLDLVVMGANTTIPGNALRLLANGLQRRRWVQDIQLIDTAKVPIIKLTTTPECIRTDIAVNDDCLHAPFYCCSEGLAQHSGVAACELVKGYIRKLPGMTSMVLLLKQYLHERGLNNSYTGGLSSYGLTLMVISYMQLFGGKKNMGMLLIDFLDYYGRKFDYNTTGISIGNHFPLSEGFRFPPAPLVIVDPFNPSHNIAAASFAIYRVKAALEELYGILVTTLESGISSSPVLSRVLVQQASTRNIDMSKFSLKVQQQQQSTRKQALRC